ncbi:MAG TPA: methyltransferase domain-containing protein [Thermoanaerobaculia bacterium]|nr:methyltransferase domain-containing protein [Thermoanaerobaculia bacterium]
MDGERRTTDTPATVDPGVSEHFRIFAEEYDDSTEWCSDPALLAPLVAGAGGRRALDLGCGTGLVAQGLRESSGEVWGLDLSYPMLAKARSRLGSRVVQGEAEALPLRSASLDLVVCRQVLHYTREAEVLCEAARVLRPGGELRLAQITSCDERDFVFWTVFKAVSQPLRRRYYSPGLLRSIVESCCFHVAEMRRHQIRRHYTQEDLFRRSPLPESERQRFRDWMRDSVEKLREVLEPEWRDGGLTILQSWTVLFCIKR